MQLAVVLVPILMSTLAAGATYGFGRLRHISELSLCVLAGVAASASMHNWLHRGTFGAIGVRGD